MADGADTPHAAASRYEVEIGSGSVAPARVLSQEGSDMSSFLGPGSSVRREDLTDEAFFGDLSELGWKGKYKYDDPEVVQFRVRPRLQPGVLVLASYPSCVAHGRPVCEYRAVAGQAITSFAAEPRCACAGGPGEARWHP